MGMLDEARNPKGAESIPVSSHNEMLQEDRRRKIQKSLMGVRNRALGKERFFNQTIVVNEVLQLVFNECCFKHRTKIKVCINSSITIIGYSSLTRETRVQLPAMER